MKVSVVIPVFNEQGSLKSLQKKINGRVLVLKDLALPTSTFSRC